MEIRARFDQSATLASNFCLLMLSFTLSLVLQKQYPIKQNQLRKTYLLLHLEQICCGQAVARILPEIHIILTVKFRNIMLVILDLILLNLTLLTTSKNKENGLEDSVVTM